MVVPREQDLLQQVFGETAHNPESNLDIRMPSPSHLHPQQAKRHPPPASFTPIGVPPAQYPPSLSQSAWSSQSSLTSHMSTMSTGSHPPTVMVAHPPFHQRPHQPSKMSQPHGAHIPIHPHHPQSAVHGNQSSVPYWPNTRKHSLSSGGEKQPAMTSGNRKQSLPGVVNRRQAVYTIQNSLSAVPHHVPSVTGKQNPMPTTSTNNSGSSSYASSDDPSNASVFGVYEPILDRAIGRGSVRDSRRLERDPDGRIYEVVHTRVVESKLNSGDGSKKGSVKQSNQNVDNGSGGHLGRKSSVGGDADAKRVRVQSLSPPRLKADQTHSRSASVHTRAGGLNAHSCNDVNVHGGHQSLSGTKNEVSSHGHRHNSYTRSYTEPIPSCKEGNHSNDKSTQEVIDRIKKNVERKEEFLKRPNQPIWLPASKAPVIHSDYHVNPQKLPRPVWPPPAVQTSSSTGSLTKTLTCVVAPKQEHQVRRTNSETGASTGGTNFPIQTSEKVDSSVESVSLEGTDTSNCTEDQNASTVLSRSLVGNAVPKPYSGSTSETNPVNMRYGKAFVTTLSRIQENIPIPELGSSSSLTSQGRSSSKQGDVSRGATPGGTPSGSETSLNSSVIRPIPLAWVGDNERIKQLQIVSKRAKQFENSQLEKESSSKSAFHRFELSRLSQRSRVPNVAQRKQEFEKRDGEQLPPGFEFEFGTHYNNSPRQRKSAELVRVNLVSQDLSPSPPKVFRSLSDGGNVFPVSRRLYSSGNEELDKSQSPVAESVDAPRLSMNRTIPIGSHHIHCEPPSQRPQSDSGVLERERSNSVCSQVSMSSLWSTQSMDETGIARQKAVARQNSYLNALCSPISVVTPTLTTAGACGRGVAQVVRAAAAVGVPVVTSASTTTAATTTTTTTITSSSAAITPTTEATMVARRNKTASAEDGERLVRRVSYLKATSGDRMYSDSDLDSDNDERSVVRGEVGRSGAGPLCVSDLPSPASLQSAVLRQGALHVKLTLVDGKRAGDRSWKAVWAVVQGHAIIFYKDRHHATQTPLGVEEQISLRGAEVEVASDYTKRRNVLRLATPGGSQLLLQADTPPEMLAWLSTLQNSCAIQEGEAGSKTSMNNNNISPQPSNKAVRKLTSSLRTRSPTGQSPSTKTRKPSGVESNSSPKSKTWRGHLKRPFMKKVHSGSPAVTPTLPLPEGATIGVCLEDCPQSLDYEYVPLLVTLCVGVVEGRGLQTQGIYRIPGNKAAVTHLIEMINKDPKSIDCDDPRWCDVNVISSMLKLFFQKLPDPLFTSELYPHFIEASKIEDPSQRMVELRRMVHELPDHHYETLRFLMMHLSNIVRNSDMNKMDVRNLAIVFGPTLVRSGDDNMVTMVTDMSHQCRIVETLISQAAWFFSEDDGEEPSPPALNQSVAQSPACESMPPSSETDTPSSQALLLHNIQKVEGNLKGDIKKDIVSSIISAANRKVHKVKYKKPAEDKPDETKYSDKEGGFEGHDIDKEVELRKQRLLAKQTESMVELPDPKPMSERKISNMSLMSVQSNLSGVSNMSQSPNTERTSGSEQTKLGISRDDGSSFSVKKDEITTSTASLTLSTNTETITTPTTSQQSSQLTPETTSLFGDEVAIRSYAGLSASTQERIRRFEMETRAMLHRDLTRHQREIERRDVERQRLEELWQRAKQDMESEDILDQMADNPTEVVRKISDYSWRLQGLSESVGGEQGSLASQGSSTSSQAALISAALSHHPLSNTPLTPTTNVTTQVPNNYPQPPVIKVVNDPSTGIACDATNEAKHGMVQQSSLPWLDYNAVSPHSTLGSTSSSGSSGYGSLTRSSHTSNPGDTEDASARTLEEMCPIESSKTATKLCTASPQSSPSNSKKKKPSKGSGFLFGLTSSSSSPSLFPSMAEGATELTPTRKIGQTTIYPESPRPPPHSAHPSSQSHLTAPSTSVTPHPSTPRLGRHKDSILHHILPSRLYHSPRPLRRGSSAENMTQQLITSVSPSTFDTQMVVNNGTLKRARTSRDQISNGPEVGMPRCGSLDSLRDAPHVTHDDGSDLLSAITATFEEKMRSLQESPLGLVTAVADDYPINLDSSPKAGQPHDCITRGNSECRLYRDPSLHRRRTNLRNPSANSSTTSTAASTTLTTTTSQVEAACQAITFVENNKLLNEDVTREIKVKRSDSLTKSEKTENNLKEKTEKRARELKRTDTQESLTEKKPKEMKRSDTQDGTERSRDLSRKSEVKDNIIGPTRRTSDVRSRRHNVKELKEKFEQNTGSQSSTSPMKPSNNLFSNNINNNNSKTNKSSMRRTGYRGPIKRRHTVGGTKDLAKWAWMQNGEVSRNTPRSTRLSAWERLQPLVADEHLNTNRSLEAWLAHERIRTSSPDLSRPQQLVLSCDVDDKENLHRRLSVQEGALNPLYPVLESHV